MASYIFLRGLHEIPEELRPRLGGKVTRRVSRRTSDKEVADREASKMAAQDDALWRDRGDKHFEKVTRLGLDLVFARVGNPPMDIYGRQEVLDWRDELLKTTKTATFKRRLDSINAVFRKACAEFQFNHTKTQRYYRRWIENRRCH